MPHSPRPTVDLDAVRTHVHAALDRRTRYAVWTAIHDALVLVAEVERLSALLTWARTEFANLMAAGRATLTADHDGEPDPLSYLRDEIEAHDFQDGQP